MMFIFFSEGKLQEQKYISSTNPLRWEAEKHKNPRAITKQEIKKTKYHTHNPLIEGIFILRETANFETYIRTYEHHPSS